MAGKELNDLIRKYAIKNAIDYGKADVGSVLGKVIPNAKGTPVPEIKKEVENIKLKKIKTAKRAILILKDLKSNYLASYAEMVLNAEIGNYKETLKVAQTLPADSANAFYYMGWALFKMGKESEAKKLIGALSLQFQSEVTVALSSEIEKAMRII